MSTVPGIYGLQQLDARKINMRSVPYHQLTCLHHCTLHGMSTNFVWSLCASDTCMNVS